MMKNLNINIPNWFELDELNALHTIMSPSLQNTGVLVASENFDNDKTCNPTVRLYLLEMVEGTLELTKELEAFTFHSSKEAQEFSQKLPSMNALDLVLHLNKRQPLFSA